MVDGRRAGGLRAGAGARAGQSKASFYLASALAQEGKIAEAVAAWQAMLAALPADSPWRGAVEQARGGGKRQACRSRQTAAPGRPRTQIDAAAEMSAEDRNAMIETMVAGLDERLRQNPRDPEGWQRLVRSYHVLGRADAARDALERGMAALGEGSDEGKRARRGFRPRSA